MKKYEKEKKTNPSTKEPEKPEMYDCADSAMTMLARCAKEFKFPLRLWAKDKWISYKDFKTIEDFEAALRFHLGAINLMDQQNTLPQEWIDLEPGDLILWDLRRHREPTYSGHTATVIEKNKCGEDACWKVLEGHLEGGMGEGEYTEKQAKDRWPPGPRWGPIWEDRGRYWNWKEILQ